jgi:signal transduction histidine kinase
MRWIAYVVTAYMLAAISWWTILLLKQNEMIYQLNAGMTKSIGMPTAELVFNKQKNMILGEGIVFGLSFLVGVYILYRFFKNELTISKSQNNFILAFSHELKSPLTSINLALSTLKKRTLSQDKMEEVCDMALDESKRLESLINSILLVAKIDDFKLNVGLHNLSQLTREVIEVIKPKLGPEQKILFQEDGVDIHDNVDQLAFKSILINLIENAVKYGKGMPITVELKNKEGVDLSVKDEGQGIQQSEKSKIFNRFYRIGDENTRSSNGTGLGLFIVKRLVELHRGSIHVSDNQPTGTIFSVSLPKIAN